MAQTQYVFNATFLVTGLRLCLAEPTLLLHLCLELGQVGVESPDVLVDQLVRLDGDLHLVIAVLSRAREHGLQVFHLGLPLGGPEVSNLSQVVVGRRVHVLKDRSVFRVEGVHEREVAPQLGGQRLQRVEILLEVKRGRHRLTNDAEY